ncbi:16S rRNA (cytosine(1402)-N(4))-methyltransferase RsmH [Polyangium sorediatum]|uniref:Ribosomal RNA small subunit methyltransferase H n=1 Tax=Polyangium sorediatum TaxID=889274 RepID=A0ABT6NW61_9BACT|nr:16S rRNA (cytosine(1402)-N(4))-methyltransferase RsmH [Polyangium sorediatum]MDI1432577.1 16S rRNA (cytosine(1402)-N(4))-methyltransferase RsmH [Polyangium sorediatum]
MNVVNVVPMRDKAPPPPELHKAPHVTVLRREVVQALAPHAGGVYVDVTLGAGGHAEAILEEAPGCRLIGVDRDETALALAKARLAPFGDRVTLVHGRFSDVEDHLAKMGVGPVDGLVADVGVSSMQIDDATRGMSFRAEGPLDMRMDPSSGETALELIERLDDDELANVIYHYGEERRSRRVARCIKQALANGELKTTLDLRRAVVRAVGPSRVGGVDPATRTFQALRVAVNGELDELEALLRAASRVVKMGGVAAVISFHSLEDRIVKHALREASVWEPLWKKPLVASDEEVAENPRARSAKLRAARRVALAGDEVFA